MDQQRLTGTRTALHGVAELVLAGPQYAASGRIRLRVTPGGFGTLAAPDLRVEGLDLVGASGTVAMHGTTFARLARACGVEARPLRDVYAVGPHVGVDDRVLLDPDAAALVHDTFALGDLALRRFAETEEPVLWPEHFDLGLTLDEVNYGVSPGDAHVPEPYAYVGPWTPRQGTFWNRDFGATRLLAELGGPDAVADFFRQGARAAAADPIRAAGEGG